MKNATRNGRESGGALAAVLVVLLGLVVVVWALRALREGNPQTAVGRMAQDVALTLEEASLAGIRGDAEPAVVRKQLLKRLEKENTEWTPRNIRKNPGLYLDHCEEMLEELKEECADALLATRIEAARQEREGVLALENAEANRRFLAAAETVEKAGTFPAKVGAYEYTGEMFTNAVKDADAMAEKNERAADTHAEAAKRARELEAFLKGTLADVEKELDDIALKRAALRADTAKKEAEEVKRRIGELMAGVSAATGTKTGTVKPEEPKDDGLGKIFERNREKTGKK